MLYHIVKISSAHFVSFRHRFRTLCITVKVAMIQKKLSWEKRPIYRCSAYCVQENEAFLPNSIPTYSVSLPLHQFVFGIHFATVATSSFNYHVIISVIKALFDDRKSAPLSINKFLLFFK